MEPFIAQIVMFGGNFAPRGWAFCNGQLLPISQNSALFSLIGTIYGGDGRTTFALPDLRSRVPMHVGTGNGLSPVREGQRLGRENIVLTAANLPPANVMIPASSEDATGDDPDGMACAVTETSNYGAADAGVSMAAGKLAGSSQAINIIPPALGINYIIALQGTFPSRS